MRRRFIRPGRPGREDRATRDLMSEVLTVFGSSLKKPGAESDQRTAHLPGHVRQPHTLSSMPGVPGTAAPASCERVRAAGRHCPGVALGPDDCRSLGSSFCVPPTSDPARPTASGPWGGVREEIRVPPLFWVSVLVWCSCGCSLIVRDNAESRPPPYSARLPSGLAGLQSVSHLDVDVDAAPWSPSYVPGLLWARL